MTYKFSSHRPTIMGTKWMITAGHPLAAEAGAAILENGGNAVDAAIAANLVLTVVRPHMCGLGGDLFALVYSAKTGKLEALNASGRSPRAATRELYLSKGYQTMPENGLLSVTVPGAISGWWELIEKHGSLEPRQLFEKAIGYAREGFPVYPELQKLIEQRRPLLEKSPAAVSVLLNDGAPPLVGRRLVQADMAESLAMLADKGPDAFYRGPLGEALVSFSEASGGLFEASDLEAHTVSWSDPLKTGYRGYEVCSIPPNSQGIALLMQANLLENYHLAMMSFGQTELIHLMVEAKKLAFADRDKYVCDPDFYPVPVDDMLSKDYAAQRIKRINREKPMSAAPAGDFTRGGEDTIYLAVVDGDGNAVSLIQSLFEPFGSCVMVPETGIMLHNRGRGFSLAPDHVNRLEPGKRPYHTLHPAMVLKKGRPHLVLGTPGADGQTQTVMQLIVNLIDFGADPQEAVEAPRWRSNPDGKLLIESRFPKKTVSGLISLGHAIELLPDWAPIMGNAQAIRVDRENGVLSGGADPRRHAYAIGQ